MRSVHRILVIGSFTPFLISLRGALLRALREHGLEVHVAAPGLSERKDVCMQLQSWGVIHHDIPLERAGLNFFRDFSTFMALFGLMKRLKPDAVLGYTIKPVIYGTLAAWMARVPNRFALITGLGYAFIGEAGGRRALVRRLVQRLYALAIGRAHKVFFQNPDDKALFSDLGLLPDRVPAVVVNGSGVDVSRFSAVPLPQGAPSFLLIGRLLGDKGIREYVAAAATLREEYPRTTFFLAGDLDVNPNSVRRDEVDAWVKAGIVEHLGHLDDVRPAISRASVYVLPSYREGTPLTVLEAMAMGRPVITTDAPGCRETVVDGSNGFLVPVKNVDALVKAMRCFIDDPELVAVMGKRSREIAEDKYDVDKVNALMLDEMGI